MKEQGKKKRGRVTAEEKEWSGRGKIGRGKGGKWIGREGDR